VLYKSTLPLPLTLPVYINSDKLSPTYPACVADNEVLSTITISLALFCGFLLILLPLLLLLLVM